ncbi:mRNA cap guanine-N7 methyltransferase [Coemansia interrupta]|uniref:mRNA cap guanine-N(7) methyltransferase n=1 Tax=Coemansia interrupta TaxID=1126814 RepID=A0A9W8LF36_9FUNG|nr:mRNA cap guanine-N7 methyltransferase [Coemansia interrupta]
MTAKDDKKRPYSAADEEEAFAQLLALAESQEPKQEQPSTKNLRANDSSAVAHDQVQSLSKAEQVAQHYNTRRELGVEGRMHTKITGLRTFNNWVKTVLINENTTPGCKVLDLGCGKGGDLRKWAFARIGEYVGMDIAQVSVLQAENRYKTMNSPSFSASFFAQDCYGEPLEKTIRPPNYQADIVSAQFCLHYAFESEAKVKQMLSNVSSHLKSGGKFIFTIPDANWLVKMMRTNDSTTFGNSVYQVKFAQREPITCYGFAYDFTLDEAVEDCTEYLVHMPTFVSLAGTYGLKLVYKQGFHHFYGEKITIKKNLELIHRMRVVDETRPEISPDEWEAIGIYLAVVFEKE